MSTPTPLTRYGYSTDEYVTEVLTFEVDRVLIPLYAHDPAWPTWTEVEAAVREEREQSMAEFINGWEADPDMPDEWVAAVAAAWDRMVAARAEGGAR